ncbi:MAG: DUF5686 family protein [candidate division Zixibacteria bacterium]|nr:DUF5686 family protein [candidate division Zixibacteria bacterium]
MPFNWKYVFFALLFFYCIEKANASTIIGNIRDIDNNEPIPAVTIRVESTGRSMIANENGYYRLLLDPGRYRLKFSNIAYNSEFCDVQVSDSCISVDIFMKKAIIQISGMKVYDKNYDAAQRIIVEAIAQKDDILNQLQSYQCDVYTKSIIYKNVDDDSSVINYILESQLEYFWKQPDQYKEIIIARRQSSNLEPNQNFLNVDNIPNFNMNRVKLGQYSIITPTATDALKYYNYYFLDTIFIDNKMVFRLEIEPKNNIDPLVFGTIDIADSTYNIVGIEGGLSKGVCLPFVKSIYYKQRFAEFENQYWMPIEICMDMNIDITFPIEQSFTIDYIAALYDYGFVDTLPKNTFKYAFEVSKEADDVDSTAWNLRQTIPLTQKEEQGYKRIDSLTNLPKPFHEKILSSFNYLFSKTLNSDLLHFNRVEGTYLGYRYYKFEPFPRTELDMKIGYAFSRKYLQHRYKAYYRLLENRLLYAGMEYCDEIKHRPVILASPNFSPTIWNLFNKVDPLDYYREKGFRFSLASDLLKQTRVYFSYQDYQQSSENNNTEYSFFRRNKKYRLNPNIAEGKLRSLSARLKYDSRKRGKIKGREVISTSRFFSQFEIGIESASPDLFENDFSFTSYYSRFKRTGNFVLPGINTSEIYIGASSGTLPPQKYFTVDFTYKIFEYEMFFRTVGEKNFIGNRVAAVYMFHNFGSWWFKKSRLPLIQEIPLSLSIFGGAFYTDFKDHAVHPDDTLIRTASKWYREIGFSLGRIPPLYTRLDFVWQLSNYDTNRFSISIGFGI